MKKISYLLWFTFLINQLYASIYQLHYDSRYRDTSVNGINYLGGPYFDYTSPDGFFLGTYEMPHIETERYNYSLGMISRDGTVMTSFMVDSSSSYSITYVDIWRKNGPFDGSTPETWIFRGERAELIEGAVSSILWFMSDNGRYIVGDCHNAAYTDLHACYWDQESKVHSLGTLVEGSFNTAQAVSNTGIVVGTEWNYDLDIQFAFIWSENQGLQNLQDVLARYGHNLDGWILTEANWINPEGTIIEGYGLDPSREMKHWSLSIPEPTSLFLLGSGLFFLRKRG